MTIDLVPEGSIKLRWKLLIAALLLAVIAEGWLLRLAWDTDKSIVPQPFTYFDGKKGSVDDFVSAKGSWISDSKQINPVQTTNINCYRSRGYCSEATAVMNSGSLNLFNDEYKITSWTNDAIEALEEYECARTVIRFDRQAKTVTSLRNTRENKRCSELGGPPVLSHLVDGQIVWNRVNGIADHH